MPAPATRVLFLGLDGATMSAFGPLFDRGLLPNLAGLWRRSAWGTLRSSTPMVTPVAWTDFATGCGPEVHGIHEFYYVESSDGTIRPNHAGRVRVPTLWETLAAEGREVVSLNLPMTYPPPDVPGIIVGGSDAPGHDWAFAQCPEFARLLAAEVPDFTHKIVWKRRPKTLDELRAKAAHNRAVFRAQADAAERADRLVDWTALMVHFHNLDSLQHRLWPYLDVDETGLREPGWNVEVESCLTALDDAAGRLMELASRRDAAVVAVSDHGFGPCRALVNVNGLLQRAGLQRGLAYGTRFRYRFHRLRDRLDRWRERRRPGGLGSRNPRSIRGEVGCDWKKTVAFAPFGQLSACVFLNPDLVGTGSPARRVRAEIVDLLLDAREPETGERLFADAFDVAEHYGIEPESQGLPEILAPSADGFQAQSKWSPFDRSLLKPDPNLPGTHWHEGILAIDAPDVRPGEHLLADLRDVAPTALAMLGLRRPESMRGRVLHEAFETPLRFGRGRSPAVMGKFERIPAMAAGFDEPLD